MRFALLTVLLLNWMPGAAVSQDVAEVRYAVDSLLLSGSQSPKVRFMQFERVTEQRKKTISEDAAVLNHIISKGMKLVDHRNALGVRVPQKVGDTEIVYSDSGLTFIYRLPLILIDDEDKNKATDAKTKSPWQEAKDEMSRSRAMDGTLVRQWGTVKRLAGQFEKTTIESLKKQVKLALENVGNFRDLSPDDSVTVLVYGNSYQSNLRTVLGWKIQMYDVKDPKRAGSAIKTVEYSEANPKLQEVTLRSNLYRTVPKIGTVDATEYRRTRIEGGDDVIEEPAVKSRKRGR